MRSLITLVPLCIALLPMSSGSPLGDRALFRKHTGAPLPRRFILSSRFDVPPACSAGVAPPSDSGNATVLPDNSTIPIPDPSNTTDPTTTSDNSTLTAPIAVDNSTVTDNSTLTDAPVDGNATAPADNSTDATAVKRYGSYDFGDAWFDLCMNSGGDIFDDSDPCFNLVDCGYSALLAESDVCAQQENADAMISFAKSSGVVNSDQLIELAVTYRNLPRESVQIMGIYPSTPYCGVAPINEELNGICNEQPEGVTAGLYGGPSYPIVPFGDDASCPYGQTPDVQTCSCLDSMYGPESNPVNSTDSSAPTYSGAPDDTSSDDTSAAAEPTPTDVGSASAAPPVETAASDSASDVASSTSAATSDAAATSGLSGR